MCWGVGEVRGEVWESGGGGERCGEMCWGVRGGVGSDM